MILKGPMSRCRKSRNSGVQLWKQSDAGVHVGGARHGSRRPIRGHASWPTPSMGWLRAEVAVHAAFTYFQTYSLKKFDIFVSESGRSTIHSCAIDISVLHFLLFRW